jgi:hypothetical protein
MNHTLHFALNDKYLNIHADAAGLNLLIKRLEKQMQDLENNQSTHFHFCTPSEDGKELTEEKGLEKDRETVVQASFYTWTEDEIKKTRI